MIIIPAFSLAGQPVDQDKPDQAFLDGETLVPCGHMDDKGVIQNPCSFKDFTTLVNAIITFALVLALPIAGIMFAYAGFLMVTSAGSTEARGKAKNIFKNAAFGLIIAAGAWLIVRTILSILGYDGAWIFDRF